MFWYSAFSEIECSERQHEANMDVVAWDLSSKILELLFLLYNRSINWERNRLLRHVQSLVRMNHAWQWAPLSKQQKQKPKKIITKTANYACIADWIKRKTSLKNSLGKKRSREKRTKCLLAFVDSLSSYRHFPWLSHASLISSYILNPPLCCVCSLLCVHKPLRSIAG